jgi:group I intron endonuclease
MIQKTYTAQDVFPAELKISGVYKIYSKSKPDRIYIGSSVDIKKRWIKHVCELRLNKHHSLKLQNHVNKYGLDDLIFKIYFPVCKESLILMEQGLINTHKPYFNIALTAGSPLGIKHTEEARKNMSEAKLGSKHHFYGKKLSLAHRKKIGAAGKGRKHTTEVIQKITQVKISHKVYTFVHETRGIKTCTQYDLYTQFNLNKSNLNAVIKGKRKSTGGWKLVTNVTENC